MTSTPDAFEHLGAAIKMARTRKGWTQAQLAERANVTKAQVSNYERGRKAPSIESLGKVMRALEMDLYDLADEIAELVYPEGAQRRRRLPLGRGEDWLADLEKLPVAEIEEVFASIVRLVAVLTRGDGGDGGRGGGRG